MPEYLTQLRNELRQQRGPVPELEPQVREGKPVPAHSHTANDTTLPHAGHGTSPLPVFHHASITGENVSRCPSPNAAPQYGQTGGPLCCGEKNTVRPVTTVSPLLPLASRNPVARSHRGPGP